ncbi:MULTISPECIES: MFS transporter [unclassified Paenibacillus]|uniref:MFS transporter n=1 Tax=unclassified Paenibacillus TaxID=185978 RepID=UPI000955A08B|nr:MULTISPECIES: MFS transporter [unclassified Paenibacillus]ASS67393.1 MFS transporter [Paenibacillus sp. RUD330]SIQ78785.1 Major Facilitator Superfamily protein [Paenibacillus sp. RU4X]SIR00211.1 Major Facilitator Superfamily protein [Paenibacillus sp. RU4T]
MKRMLGILIIMSLVATSVSSLFPLFHRDYGLNSLELTLLFASYAAVLLPVLLLTGVRAASWGHKRVIRAGIWLSIGSSLLFMLSADAWMLYAARMVEGAAYGLFTGTATPFLLRHTPSSRTGKAILLSGMTVSLGFGIGPAITGLFAQYASVMPSRLPYALFIVLLLACAAVLETLHSHEEENKAIQAAPNPDRDGATGANLRAIPAADAAGALGAEGKSRERRGALLGVPASIGRHFWTMSALSGFTIFTLNGIVLSLIPMFVTNVLHSSNLSISGLLVLLLLGGGALTQLIPLPLNPVVRLRSGLLILAAGAWTVVLSGHEGSLSLLWLGVGLQALGSGWSFQASLRFAGELPRPADRPRVITTYYLAAYSGFIVPMAGLGVLSYAFGMSTAMVVLNILGLLLVLYAAFYSVGFKREYGALLKCRAAAAVSGTRPTAAD